MNEDAQFEAWCRARAEADVPDAFVDDVMAAVENAEEQRAAGTFWLMMTSILGSRAGRAALLLLGLAAFAVRVVGTLGVFFTGDV